MKRTRRTPSQPRGPCSSTMKKDRRYSEVEKVDLSCHRPGRQEEEGQQRKVVEERERVQHHRGFMTKHIKRAYDHLFNKQKPAAVPVSLSRCSKYEGKFNSSFAPLVLEQRRTACIAKDTGKDENGGRKVEKQVAPGTKTYTSREEANLTEKKEKFSLRTQSQVNGVRREGKAEIENQAKQPEEDLGVVFREIEGESPRDRKRETFKDLQSYTLAARKIEAIPRDQQEEARQRERDQKTKAAYEHDPRIKKWSHGKEGNLRALLSTLQNALWQECNWKTVLTSELVTPSSVKKVYRIAQICLHPDKVQQRGGSVEQKYVAEKIFGVLREAWDKFYSEELA